MAKQMGYGFYAGRGSEYAKIRVEAPKEAKINKQQLFLKISRELPPWVFLFVAPEQQPDGRYSPPMVLDQGKPEFFVYPS
jgi:hypothetical protein